MNELLPSPVVAAAMPACGTLPLPAGECGPGPVDVAPEGSPIYRALIPPGDVEEFMGLSDEVRLEFGKIARRLPGLLAAEKRKRTKACAEASRGIGISKEQVYRRVFTEYAKSHDWRVLTNRTKARLSLQNDIVGVPKATIEFYRALTENNKRCDHGGHLELIAIWKTHRDSNGRTYERIPGYTSWPVANPHTGIPKGWTYSNLQRLAKSHPYDKAATRISEFAASAFLPPVLTTRIGLKLLERIELDDHEYNVKIHFPGQSKAMRPRGFNAIDALTCCIFAKSFKPTLWDAELHKKEALTETDFKWFVVHILTDIGFRTDSVGTTLVCERGTAAIKPAFEQCIHAVTNGHIKISRGSMMDGTAHPGQFPGQGKGNFKHKPLIEGSFSLVDNYFAALPGETGLDRNHFPTDTDGREKYMALILRHAEKMPAELAADLRLSLLGWTEFMSKAMDLYDAINWRRDHQIGDWEACGFTTFECRWDDQMPWVNMRNLPIHVQQSIAAAGDVIQTRPAKLSRQEAFNALIKSPDIQRIPPILYPELMGADAARELTVNKQSLFEFDDSDYGAQPFRYLAATKQKQFAPGQVFQCYVNPWNPRVLVACDDAGRVQGLCEWWDMPCKNDTEAHKRQMGKVSHWKATRTTPIAARHIDASEDRAHMLAHNEAVIQRAKGEDKETKQFATIADEALNEI